MVTFDGLDSRRGPLSWSQRGTWETRHVGSNINHIFTVTVPVGRTVVDISAAVTAMVARHEVLRTTYRTGPDGVPEQVVHERGTVPLDLREAGDRAACDVAAEWGHDLAAYPFDLEAELPWRLGLVTESGRPALLVVASATIMLDGWSLVLLHGEFHDRLSAGSPPAEAPAHNPLDRVAFETSEQGRAVARAGLAHWREQISFIEAIPPPAWRPAGETPRTWHGTFVSVALPQAAHAVADRLRVPVSAVLLAGISTVVGHRLGQPALGLLVPTSNRYRPEARRAVTRYVQFSPMFLDLATATFPDLVATTWRRMYRAARFAQHDPMDVMPLALRDGRLVVPITFNYVHQKPYRIEPISVHADELRDSATRSTFSWSRALERAGRPLLVHVQRFDAEARLGLWVDTQYLSRADLVAIVFGTERLLIEAFTGVVSMSRLIELAGLPAPGQATTEVAVMPAAGRPARPPDHRPGRG